jgi:magnesium-transporting ATPase (P-type)
MELAVVLAGGLRDWVDFGVIIGILMLNAFVGWYQEKQAGDIVAQLKAGIALRALVSSVLRLQCHHHLTLCLVLGRKERTRTRDRGSRNRAGRYCEL